MPAIRRALQHPSDDLSESLGEAFDPVLSGKRLGAEPERSLGKCAERSIARFIVGRHVPASQPSEANDSLLGYLRLAEFECHWIKLPEMS